MQRVESIWDVTPQILQWQCAGDRIGFVPTMGNLHAGHMQLIRRAQQVASRVVVSIYVNPMQFGASEDFSAYPRTLEKDLLKLEQAGVSMVFTPSDQTMYPQGVESTSFVDVPGWLSQQLEGAHRPQHFRGVATVVSKLFHMVHPDVAVFGEKDFQQLKVIEKMVHDLNLPIEILAEPTVRESNGLAMSSRNQYLSPAQRSTAAELYATLNDTRERILMQNMALSELEQAAIMQLEKRGFDPDYVAIRCSDTLQEADTPTEQLVILAAVRLGNTRLIDNLRV